MYSKIQKTNFNDPRYENMFAQQIIAFLKKILSKDFHNVFWQVDTVSTSLRHATLIVDALE